ncbi:hypothetical protein SUGI_0979340 [Cryptomeria japonica]|uniref:G-type lectin S-receptor-like serine/threonine-protein kinase SD3-1 n=1 Tax=Cryptomeria japonica TaxID=3369 RepID=UPI0024146E32|nr:G-type lectin S-receptor-like serine/threonine-protein kinase SD3-1 [Cryptomeria japonica]GLJ46468.1 hypothetical protein SUGI_0979340 [Cryptomeria japonica]
MVTSALAWASRCQYVTLLVIVGFVMRMSTCSSEKKPIWASIPLGSKLSASEEVYWLSQNGTFAMGFFSIEHNGIYSVGIWYNSIPKQAQAVVWTAGDDVRVSSNSTFELGADGNFILFDHLVGTPAWTSNTSNIGVVGACFHDNGNFVLTDNEDRIVWGSFHSPTDTLLPGQTLAMGQTLRASSKTSIASHYALELDEFGNLVLKWSADVVYWESRTGSSADFLASKSSVPTGASFLGNGILGLFNEERSMVWSRYSGDFTDPSVVLRHLRLDSDGNLRMYSWIEATKMWAVGWQAVENQCGVFNTCGLYGVCSFNSTGPICQCPFEKGSNSEQILEGGVSRACRKKMKLGDCSTGTSILVLKKTVLYGIYPPQDVYNYSSVQSCRDNCLKDSSCVAATAINDGSGICRIKRTDYISGYSYESVPAISFLKVCLTPEAVSDHAIHLHPNRPSPNSLTTFQSPSPNASSSRTPGLFGSCIGVAIIATFGAFLAIQIGVGWYIFTRKGIRRTQTIPSTKHQLMDPCSRSLVRLTFVEIGELTGKFSHQLGPTVFKGILPNSNPVIIKQLSVQITEKEFRMILCSLGITRHRNLVCLQGFCCEAQHRIIVYEYVNNGSLDQWLFGCTNKARELNWQRRFHIVIGIARAIAYLHSECRDCISHSNLKLENVMLDDKFIPKLTDFGLSRLSQATSSETESTSCSESSPEQDVFRFGLMLLQIISGKRDPNCDCPENKGIREWAFQEYQNGRLDGIVDDRMEGNLDWDQVERALRIAFWCMQDRSCLRPCIREVAAVLEGTCPVDPPPIPHTNGQEIYAGGASKLKERIAEEKIKEVKEEIKEETNEEVMV